jgi:hypothetical protein
MAGAGWQQPAWKRKARRNGQTALSRAGNSDSGTGQGRKTGTNLDYEDDTRISDTGFF